MPFFTDKTKLDVACEICDKPATNTHYGVYACGGCRAFHKRTVMKRPTYRRCAGNCPTTAESRVRCKSCRFRKYADLIAMKKRERAFLKGREDRKKTPDSERNRRESSSEFDDILTLTSVHESDWSAECDQLKFLDRPDSAISSSVSQDQQTMTKTSPTSLRDRNPRSSADWETLPLTNPLNENWERVSRTVTVLKDIVIDVFGDHIAIWSTNLELAKRGHFANPPEAGIEEMVAAINSHNDDNAARTFKFVTSLPGICDLEASTIGNCLAPGWKEFVFCTIHHAAFMTPTETYITVGPNQLPYNRYWDEMLLDWPVVDFWYSLSTQFRDIGLNQMEGYLLLVLIMFEPGDDNQNVDVKRIHHLYANVLLDVLKWRCTDAAEFNAICRKLERFFCVFRMADCLYRRYGGSYSRRHWLTDSVDAVLEADQNGNLFERRPSPRLAELRGPRVFWSSRYRNLSCSD